MNVHLKAIRVEVTNEKTGVVKSFTNYRLYFSEDKFITIKPVFDNDFKLLNGLVYTGVIELLPKNE